MKNGFIFDVDGVIADTADYHYSAWKQTIAKHGMSLSVAENENIKGLSRIKTLEAILSLNKKTISQEEFDLLCKQKNELYLSMLEEMNKDDALAGIREFFKKIKAKKVNKIAIASSSFNAPLILEKLNLLKYVDFISNPGKIKNGKPYPDIYLNAAKGIKIKPENCIGFEDAIEGLKGLDLGYIDSVGICWSNQQIKENSSFSVNTTEQLDYDEIINFFKYKNYPAQKINKEAILHTGYGKFAYQNKKDSLSVILRVKKDNIKRVIIRKGDPFDWRSKNQAKGVTQFGGTKDMFWNEEIPSVARKFLSDDLFDYYRAEIATKYRRIRYAFELESYAGDKLVYGEGGFAKSGSKIDSLGFTWGFLHEGNLSEIPSWVSETIWYQIFPERFSNGDKSNDNENTKPWKTESPQSFDYYGGDLRGVINNLDHILELGCNGIYFTPIFKANTNHKYDTEDYLKIDEHFGDEKLLDELILKAHQKGIRIMFDAVFNHSGSQFKQWQDVVKNKENSKYYDWFFVYDPKELKPAQDYAPGYFQYQNQVYETFAFTPFMPRLNWANPEVSAYFKKVTNKWTKAKIDAWRLDVANEPSLEFWRNFRKWVKDINPDNYILGEIWYDSNLYLQGDCFDSVMNYNLRSIIQNSIKEKWDANKFSEMLSKYLLLYTDPIKKGMFNLLGSHDTPRFLSELKNNEQEYLFGYKILFLMLGSPCIYYGDEIGMDGGHDPDCRKPMQWDKSKWNMNIYTSLQKIIQLRKNYSCLRNGEYLLIQSSHKDIFIMKHYNEEETLYSLINFSEKNISFDIEKLIMDKNLISLIEDKKINKNKISIKAKDIVLLKPN